MEAGDNVDDLRFQNVNRAVGKVPRRVFDLFMEGHHRVTVIKLKNAAGAGVVGSKPKHRDQMTGWPHSVSRDQPGNEVHGLLRVSRGWPPERYEAWLRESLTRILLP